ncbi:RNA-binding protein Cwf29 [Umbelopsis nana]
MNVVKEIQRINERESERGFSESGSWHAQYKDSSYIFVGGLPYDLSEGDIICIFSQYGEIINLNMPRNKDTGKTRGFAFLQYEDQRSTILAVDNLNGSKVLGRVLRVDHSQKPKPKKDEDGNIIEEPAMNAAPPLLEASNSEDDSEDDGIDAEDPMAQYMRKREKKRKRKEEKSKKKKSQKSDKEKRERPAHEDGASSNNVKGIDTAETKGSRMEEDEGGRLTADPTAALIATVTDTVADLPVAAQDEMAALGDTAADDETVAHPEEEMIGETIEEMTDEMTDETTDEMTEETTEEMTEETTEETTEGGSIIPEGANVYI